MRARLLGFAFGFGFGIVALTVLLWATGRLETRGAAPERGSGARVEARQPIPPPPQGLIPPPAGSADRQLEPPPEQAVQLPEQRLLQQKQGRIGPPILGLKASDLADTFEQTRGGARRHEAVDILAPRGTPVVAVDEGNVAKLFTSDQGGLTVYQFDNSRRYCYYYAHLDRYAPGLREGMLLRRGDPVGYVGSSGNADPAAPHLHFAVFELGPEKRWWEGKPLNPYPLLVEAIR